MIGERFEEVVKRGWRLYGGFVKGVVFPGV
jgi:hypothetical protein